MSSFSLRDLVRKVILEDMLGGLPNPEQWKIMIIDKDALSIMNFACRIRDVMAKNITIIENIDLKRQPFPQLDAIYFITPTNESISKLIADFEGPTKLYAHAHVYFTSRVSKTLMGRLGESEALKKAIKTLIELNIEFVAFEKNCFQLRMKEDIQYIYGSPDEDKSSLAELIARQLYTFCLTTKSNPFIRYQKSKNNNICELVSQKLADRIAQSRALKKGELKDDCVMLLCDRSIDPVAPLLHEFTYQAMAYDLCNIGDDNIYEYKYKDGKEEEKIKKVILDENDETWNVFRLKHIFDSRKEISDQYTKFIEQNREMRSLKSASGGNNDTKQIASVISKLPQYQEQLSKYAFHLTLSKNLMDLFKDQKLGDVAIHEQNMAMGTDVDGKDIKTTILSQISTVLRDETISPVNKVRLVMLYLITQGGVKDDKKQGLMRMAKLEEKDIKTIDNLMLLGIQLSKQSSGSKLSSLFSKKKNKQGDFDYTLSRYTPKLKELAEELIKGKLSTSDFPYISNEPSNTFSLIVEQQSQTKKKKRDTVVDKKGTTATTPTTTTTSLRSRANQPAWAEEDATASSSSDRSSSIINNASNSSSSNNVESQSRSHKKLFLIMLGGMTYSEMRAGYELDVENGCDVVVGGTSILTPTRFIEKVSQLHTHKIQMNHE